MSGGGRMRAAVLMAAMWLLATTVQAGQLGLVVNGDFEQGPGAGWQEASLRGYPIVWQDPDDAYAGQWFAWLGGEDNEVSQLWQDLVIPANHRAELRFWLLIGTFEPGDEPHDLFDVQIDGQAVFQADNTDQTDGFYVPVTVDITAYADGQSHELRFTATCDAIASTSFYVDDVAVVVTSLPDDGDDGDDGDGGDGDDGDSGGSGSCATAAATSPAGLLAGLAGLWGLCRRR